MQPSKGLHNQVVKIVVPYCTVGLMEKNDGKKARLILSCCRTNALHPLPPLAKTISIVTSFSSHWAFLLPLLSTGDFLYITTPAKKVVIFTYFLLEYVNTSGHVLGFNQCKDTFWGSINVKTPVTRVENLSPTMRRGINSRNRVWNWVAKLHRLAGRYDNPMPTWFLGLKLPTLDWKF